MKIRKKLGYENSEVKLNTEKICKIGNYKNSEKDQALSPF